MKTFTINAENEIVAFASPEEAAANTPTPFDTFTNQQEFAELATAWPAERLVEIWNSLAGVVPVKAFRSPKAAITRIWERIQRLGDTAVTKAERPGKSGRHGQRAKGGAQGAKGAHSKRNSGKKGTPAKGTPKGKARAKADGAPRQGSKTARVVSMLQRKGGAALAEIAEEMGWQKHTVRGFMAGAMKKAGYAVESFKPAGGQRTYRISA